MAELVQAFFIFTLRLCDVTLGTLRAILVVRGIRTIAACVGFIETCVWLFAIQHVLTHLNNGWNLLGYSLGYAAGILMGAAVEERLGFGFVNFQIVSKSKTRPLLDRLRLSGFGATTMAANVYLSNVSYIRVTTPRKRIDELKEIVHAEDPESFITIEDIRHVRGGYHSPAPSP